MNLTWSRLARAVVGCELHKPRADAHSCIWLQKNALAGHSTLTLSGNRNMRCPGRRSNARSEGDKKNVRGFYVNRLIRAFLARANERVSRRLERTSNTASGNFRIGRLLRPRGRPADGWSGQGNAGAFGEGPQGGAVPRISICSSS